MDSVGKRGGGGLTMERFADGINYKDFAMGLFIYSPHVQTYVIFINQRRQRMFVAFLCQRYQRYANVRSLTARKNVSSLLFSREAHVVENIKGARANKTKKDNLFPIQHRTPIGKFNFKRWPFASQGTPSKIIEL